MSAPLGPRGGFRDPKHRPDAEEVGDCWARLDGRSQLLLRSLAAGPRGALRAASVFLRQRRAGPGAPGSPVTALCRGLGPPHLTDTRAPGIQPLVCCLPPPLKQNLLAFVSLVHPLLPRASVQELLLSLGQDPSPWVSALARQLGRDTGLGPQGPLCSPGCSHRLRLLSQRCAGGSRGWADCFAGSREAGGLSDTSEQGTQRKRKSSQVDLDGEEPEPRSKRSKVEAWSRDGADADDAAAAEAEAPGTSESEVAVHENLEPATDSERPHDALPPHLKNSVLQIQEVLESEADWDQNSVDLFKVLNECDHTQVEMLCNTLRLPDLPEQTLPKLCGSVLAPSPDLSYTTATKFIKSLLLKKVLSLSEPASRCLVTAVTSLCGCYPRPMCQALILPVLEDKNIGNPQSELLNRLIENCLDSHYRLLILQMTFKIAWNEAVLSVIHCVLAAKPDVSEALFTQFTEQLLTQGPQFTKSVKFAKMMLTVLTKYSTSVTATHKQSLHSCLLLNETFLKKSLQAALKRITHS